MSKHFSIEGHIVDVVNQEIFDGVLDIKDGRIIDIRRQSTAPDSPYILPGFYDAHMHIESTLMMPENFAKLAVAQGTIGVINDPHEIANVLDIEGVEYMLASCAKVRFHFHTSAPSCVPSTPFETAGGNIDSAKLTQLLNRDEIYGCGELMNVPGILNEDPEIIAKIEATLRCGKIADGHAPAISNEDAKKYFGAGISTNHECTQINEAEEQIALGVMIAIREGSAACDFESLSPLLAKHGTQLAFCTDDIYPDELMQGHINLHCRRAMAKGYPLWNILHAACVEPVKHYKLNHGLLQKGDAADFICVTNLKEFHVTDTYIDGYCVFHNGQVTKDILQDATPITTPYPNHFLAEPIHETDIRLNPVSGKRIKVIDSHEGSLLTDTYLTEPKTENGNVVSDTANDVLKLVCLSRHSKAQPAIGFIRGFGLTRGAIASTIGHDSHNIIALGTNDRDIAAAINRLVASQGGLVACCGEEYRELPLPIAGLMSPNAGEKVATDYVALREYACKELGCHYKAPFMTLAFMSLPVIPELKLTDKGLFDGIKFTFTDIWE